MKKWKTPLSRYRRTINQTHRRFVEFHKNWSKKILDNLDFLQTGTKIKKKLEIKQFVIRQIFPKQEKKLYPILKRAHVKESFEKKIVKKAKLRQFGVRVSARNYFSSLQQPVFLCVDQKEEKLSAPTEEIIKKNFFNLLSRFSVFIKKKKIIIYKKKKNFLLSCGI